MRVINSDEREKVGKSSSLSDPGFVGVGSCTCSCSPLVSLLLTSRRMRPFLSSETRSVTMPITSMFWRPPSRPQLREIFSSTRRCTLSRNKQQLPHQRAGRAAPLKWPLKGQSSAAELCAHFHRFSLLHDRFGFHMCLNCPWNVCGTVDSDPLYS